MSDAYLGGPAEDAAEAQLAMQKSETLLSLSDGAQNMLLHIARIRPLPKPFPSEAEGRRHLAELLFADLIEPVSEVRFEATESGRAAASALVPCETCNGYGCHPADGGSYPCPDCKG